MSVPGLAHGLETFDDIEPHVFGTIDEANPQAAQAWGPRVQAFSTCGPASLQRAPKMATALTSLDPDVLDVQGLWTWSSKVNLNHYRRTQRPYMITPRGMLDPWARSNSVWKKKLFATLVERAHINAAHAFRATAEMEAQHFRNMGITAPIAVVPNAIETRPLAKRPPSNGRRRVAFLSRVHPKKGIDYLLRAWSALEGQFPEW
ncbi:MAG: glycosyltransferase, partial [Pseudomonadota bacterium]